MIETIHDANRSGRPKLSHGDHSGERKARTTSPALLQPTSRAISSSQRSPRPPTDRARGRGQCLGDPAAARGGSRAPAGAEGPSSGRCSPPRDSEKNFRSRGPRDRAKAGCRPLPDHGKCDLRIAEVALGLAGRVDHRDKDLGALAPPFADGILDRRQVAVVAVLVAEPLEDPAGGVPLLLGGLLVGLEDLGPASSPGEGSSHGRP
jgi:hypothetical protein